MQGKPTTAPESNSMVLVHDNCQMILVIRMTLITHVNIGICVMLVSTFHKLPSLHIALTLSHIYFRNKHGVYDMMDKNRCCNGVEEIRLFVSAVILYKMDWIKVGYDVWD